MNYFTPEAIHWDAPPGGFRAADNAYQAHLARLWPNLSPQMQALTKIDLQDGLVRQVVVDRETAAVILRLRCGCLQNAQGVPVGYFDLDLHYRGAAPAPDDVEALREAAQERAEVLFSELDQEPDGRFVHRLLCTEAEGDAYRELTVRFRELELVRTPRGDGRGRAGWPRKRYVEVPPSAG